MSLGNNAYYNALKRKEFLKKELERVEHFIRQCESYANDPNTLLVTGTESEHMAIDIRIAHGVTRNAHVIRNMCKEAILEAERPLQRTQLIEAIERKGIFLNVSDKPNYLGTIMWRAKDEFVNLKDFGYWPRDIPYSEAKYEPTNPHSEQSMSGPSSCDTNH